MLGGDDSHTVPGCLSFIVAEDATDSNVLWVTEVWQSQAAHEASLQAPTTKESFTDADTLIAAFEKVATTHAIQRSSHPLHGERSRDLGPP